MDLQSRVMCKNSQHENSVENSLCMKDEAVRSRWLRAGLGAGKMITTRFLNVAQLKFAQNEVLNVEELQCDEIWTDLSCPELWGELVAPPLATISASSVGSLTTSVR